ncbi:MAG: N-acetylmuramoyl-L-alanine amidase [Bacteroidota bacterium]
MIRLAYGRRVCLLLPLVVLGLVWTTAVQAAPVVERISVAARSDGAGYVVRFHLSERLQAYSVPTADGAHGITFTLFNTRLARTVQQDPPQGPLKQLRSRMEAGHLHISMLLDETQPIKAEAYRDRDTPDLLLSLTYTDQPARQQALPVAPVAVRPEAAPPAQEETERSTERINAFSERWQLDTVVIDAGHGGHDPGTIGVDGLREKDIVLPVALKLGQYIEERMGLRVVYTRDTDTFVELHERGRIANRERGKLFISIHANGHSRSGAYGTETFFLGLHRTETAREVMERENSVILLEDDQDYYEQYGGDVQFTLAQSAYLRKSEQLASLIEDQFAQRVNRKSRGVKQAGFIVLHQSSMPGVLVELGFLTNPDEAAFLRTEEGQTFMASAIFRAVRDFRAQYERDLLNATPN